MARLISGSATLTGLAHSSAGVTGGISDGNHLEANANVADNDFLRVDGTEIEGRSASQTLSDIGAAAIGANSDITSITGLTTDLAVAHGGTGASTLTANYALLGNGTSAPQMIAPSTSGNVLTSNGSTWASAAAGGGGIMVSFDSGKYEGSTIGKSDSAFTEVHDELRCAITPTDPNKVVMLCTGGSPYAATSSRTLYSSWGIIGGSMNLADSAEGLETITWNYKTGGHSFMFVHTPSSYGSEIIYTPTYSTLVGTCYFTEGGSNQNIWAIAIEIKQ